MKCSEKGLKIIKDSEGFKPKMYYCPANKPTIGYGTLITPQKDYLMNKTIDENEATELLKSHLADDELQINKLNLKLNQNQFDAIMSFVYNLGFRAFFNSTLYKKIKANPNDITIRSEFAKWINAGGKPLAGLVTRRRKETELYFSKL